MGRTGRLRSGEFYYYSSSSELPQYGQKNFRTSSTTLKIRRNCIAKMIFKLLFLSALSTAAPTSNTIVRTATGYYTGVVNETFPDVRAFVNVPFGQSTAGTNRFMPPLAVPASNDHIDATKYPGACPQYVSSIKAIWNQEIPQYLQYWGASNYTAGVSAPFASEDCLRLAIWTPANATSASNLPVAMVSVILLLDIANNSVLDWWRLSNKWYSCSRSNPKSMGK